MKRHLAVASLLLWLLSPSLLADDGVRKSVIWRNAYGTPVYEGVYQLTKVEGKPVFKLVRSYVYGPFAYRCMTPDNARHDGVNLRYYIKVPTVCYVPPGYKVFLQRAHVGHHGNPVLPYLYDTSGEATRSTEIPDFKDPVFYRRATLIPTGTR